MYRISGTAAAQFVSGNMGGSSGAAAAQFVSDNESNFLEVFSGSRIERFKEEAKAEETPSKEQRRVRGKSNLPLLAHVMDEVGMGGQA